MIVTTAEELEALVEDYCAYDAVVFDLETMHTPTPAELAEVERLSERPQRLWTPDEKAWHDVFKLKATDSLQNETIWFGLATYGRSDAVATGHPKGDLISEAHKVETTPADWFGEDDERAYTPGGKLSTRAIVVDVPASFAPPPPQLDIKEACEIMRPLFFDSDRRIVNQNIKFDIKSLVRHFGDFIPGPYGDTMIAQHLIDENAFIALQLGKMVERHLGHTYSKLGSKGVHNFEFKAAARYAEQDAKFTWLLWRKYERLLERDGFMDLFEFEMQVLDLLMRKEYDGAFIDIEAMAVTRLEYVRRKDDVVADLLANHPVPPTFNFDSAKQKGVLLYDDLGATVLKTTDSGQPSTDADTLQKLVDARDGEASEVAGKLLAYAAEAKVIGTYFVGMGAKLDESGYLHPDFAQHIADTNRLSCLPDWAVLGTSRGEFTMGEYEPRPGDLVRGHDGRWHEVEAKIYNGVLPMVMIEFSDGSRLQCTEDHRLHGPNGWVHARDLVCGSEVHRVSEQELCRGFGEGSGSDRYLPGPGQADDGAGGGGLQHGVRHSAVHSQHSLGQGAVAVREVVAQVSRQSRSAEPDVREEGRAASQLQGSCEGRARVLADQEEREVRLRAQDRYGRDPWIVRVASRDGGAPHRRGEDEQRPGQPRSGDSWGTPATSCTSVYVREVAAVAPAPAFDISVEGSHSYVAEGFFQHNCREPNVHNIPRDSEMRDMFVAPPGYVVIGADYDQIELRFIASESQDPVMMEVFLSGEDVHATTASLVLNKPLEDVTGEERTLYGKMPNFLIGYGGTAFTLAAKTGISEKEAQQVLDTYFARFSRINPWKEEVVDLARSRMVMRDSKLIVPPYVETMMGYRRRLPDLLQKPSRAANRQDRQKMRSKLNRAQRQAVNSITQGSAAETLKIAMLDVHTHCTADKFPMRLALNIHDEIICYCAEDHADEGLEILETMMANVVNPFTGEPPLKGGVALQVEGYISDRWLKG